MDPCKNSRQYRRSYKTRCVNPKKYLSKLCEDIGKIKMPLALYLSILHLIHSVKEKAKDEQDGSCVCLLKKKAKEELQCSFRTQGVQPDRGYDRKAD